MFDAEFDSTSNDTIFDLIYETFLFFTDFRVAERFFELLPARGVVCDSVRLG